VVLTAREAMTMMMANNDKYGKEKGAKSGIIKY
jgi:hypothetical protein